MDEDLAKFCNYKETLTVDTLDSFLTEKQWYEVGLWTVALFEMKIELKDILAKYRNSEYDGKKWIKVDPKINDDDWEGTEKSTRKTYCILELYGKQSLNKKVYISMDKIALNHAVLFIYEGIVKIVTSTNPKVEFSSRKLISKSKKDINRLKLDILTVGNNEIDILKYKGGSGNWFKHSIVCQLYFWFTIARISNLFAWKKSTATPKARAITHTNPIWSEAWEICEFNTLMYKPLQARDEDTCTESAIIAAIIRVRGPSDTDLVDFITTPKKTGLDIKRSLTVIGISSGKFVIKSLARCTFLKKPCHLIIKMMNGEDKHIVYGFNHGTTITVYNSWNPDPIVIDSHHHK